MQNWKTQKYTTTQEACGSAASSTLDITRKDFFSHGKSGTVVVVVSFISNRIQQSNNTRKKKTLCRYQGWGQFHFFNSIPIPIPLFSIPIPIPLLPISFNSNSNSRDFYSNSNSGDFKSNLNRRNDLLKSSVKLIIIIITRYMWQYIKLLLLIPSVSYALLNGYNYMASWLIPYQ